MIYHPAYKSYSRLNAIAKIQNAFYKELLKKEHRDYYKQWKDDWDDWNGELRTLYQTQDDELYAKKAAKAQGGRKQKKRSIRTNKRHNSKKRAYKKRSYKNKTQKKSKK